MVESDPYSPFEIGKRLELMRRGLGYDEEPGGITRFCNSIPGGILYPQKWNNYIGDNPRDRIPPDVALAIIRVHPDVDTSYIYQGLKDGLKSRLRRRIEELEAQAAPPKPRQRAKR